MAEGKLSAYATLRVKTGEYIVNGKTKNRYATIGTLLSTPHHSNMVIKIDTMPVFKDWDGTVYVNVRDDWQGSGPEEGTPGERKPNDDIPF